MSKIDIKENPGLVTSVVLLGVISAVGITIALLIFDSFLLQYVWNTVIVRLFPVQTLSLIQTIAINLLVIWFKLGVYEPEKKSAFMKYFIQSGLLLLIALVISTYYL